MSPQQALWLLLDQPEAFYGGAAGGGKTFALLLAALQYVDQPGYAALLLRRTFPQLAQPGQLIETSKEWLLSGDVPGRDRPRWNESKKTWTFPSGAVLVFGHVEDESSVFNYQGGGYQFTGFDELTQFSERMYKYIAFSRRRRSLEFAKLGIPNRVRSTANPGGVGHVWVKDRFIDKRKSGVVFIPAKVWDNRGLDVPEYVQTLSELDETLRAQLLDGDWGAFENQAFPSFGDPHLIETFELSNAHDRIEAMDYGLNGTAWALLVSDYEGNLIFYDELAESNLLPDEVCKLVDAKRKAVWRHGNTVYADPTIWHRTSTRNKFGDPAVLADEFADNSVPLTKANNDPRAGLIRLRMLMVEDPNHLFPPWHERAGEANAPRLYVVRRQCPNLVERFKQAPLQPIDKADGGEKIDVEWESRHGHFVAMARYAVMAKPAPSMEPPSWAGTPPQHRTEYQTSPEELRAEWLREWRERQERERRRPAQRRTERV